MGYTSIIGLIDNWRAGVVVDGRLGDQPLSSYILSGVDINDDGGDDYFTMTPDSNFYNLPYINALATEISGVPVNMVALDTADGAITINNVAYDVFGHDGTNFVTAAHGSDGVIIIAPGAGASSGTLGNRITLSNGSYDPNTGNFSGNAQFDSMTGQFTAAGGITPTFSSEFISGIVYGSDGGVFSGGFLGANVPNMANP